MLLLQSEFHFWEVGIILGMGLANKSWRYNIKLSLIGWAHTQNDPWKGVIFVLKFHMLFCHCAEQFPVIRCSNLFYFIQLCADAPPINDNSWVLLYSIVHNV